MKPGHLQQTLFLPVTGMITEGADIAPFIVPN
jgi:hypothetical protein